MKNIGYIISFCIAYLFYFPFKILPYRVCLVYAKGIVLLLYPLARKHRKIALENIRYAFPEKSEKEAKELLFKHFLHLGNLLAGSLYASRMNQAWIDKYLIYDEKSLQIEESVKKEGVGVVLITGHLGTWEFLVQFMGIRMKGAGIYKKIRNPYIDRWLKKLRENNGILLITTDETSAAIKLLKKGYWIGFGTDQNAGSAGIFINFLNRPASTYAGAVLMAYLTNSRLLYYSVVCGDKGKVLVRVRDLGFVDKKKFPDKDDVIRYYTHEWTKVLEEEIKLFPEQYFWVHRRWRTKPGDFAGQK
jgi:KDO2-lipid IV(A) lauroyltransferase